MRIVGEDHELEEVILNIRYPYNLYAFRPFNDRTTFGCWVWWLLWIISVLWGLKQENHFKFLRSLGYVTNFRSFRAIASTQVTSQ